MSDIATIKERLEASRKMWGVIEAGIFEHFRHMLGTAWGSEPEMSKTEFDTYAKNLREESL